MPDVRSVAAHARWDELEWVSEHLNRRIAYLRAALSATEGVVEAKDDSGY